MKFGRQPRLTALPFVEKSSAFWEQNSASPAERLVVEDSMQQGRTDGGQIECALCPGRVDPRPRVFLVRQRTGKVCGGYPETDPIGTASCGGPLGGPVVPGLSAGIAISTPFGPLERLNVRHSRGAERDAAEHRNPCVTAPFSRLIPSNEPCNAEAGWRVWRVNWRASLVSAAATTIRLRLCRESADHEPNHESDDLERSALVLGARPVRGAERQCSFRKPRRFPSIRLKT
jgi:hypothetical protein